MSSSMPSSSANIKSSKGYTAFPKQNTNECTNKRIESIETESHAKVVLTVPRQILNFVASENTWVIVLVMFFLVVAVGVLGIFIDDEPLDKSHMWDTYYYYEAFDGSDDMIPIPHALLNLADISKTDIEDDAKRNKQTSIALFLYIPRMGGRSLLEFVGPCFDLIQASDLDERAGGIGSNARLQVLTNQETHEKYVNINTFSIDGILHAKDLHFSATRNADIISTPFLYEFLDILYPADGKAASSTLENVQEQEKAQSSTSKLRLITLLRDPMEQINSYYYYISSLSPSDVDYDESLPANITLIDYLKLPDRREFNYVTKLLVNKLFPDAEPLVEEDVITAKQILFQKCIVGLLSNKAETLSRWQKLFQWDFQQFSDSSKSDVNDCQGEFLTWEISHSTHDSSKNPGLPPQDSPELKLLYEKNNLDVELYEYAKTLFVEQGALFLDLDDTSNLP